MFFIKNCVVIVLARDLPAKQWIRIRESEEEARASVMKVFACSKNYTMF